VDCGLLLVGSSAFFYLFTLFFIVFWDGEATTIEVGIKSSLPYPLFVGLSSAGGGRVESCAWWISRDPIGLRFRWCGFMPISFDIRFSLLVMVITPARWLFRVLVR
jgi:hypothetical protein